MGAPGIRFNTRYVTGDGHLSVALASPAVTPTLTLYVPLLAVDGTDQVVLNVCVSPALKPWFQTFWKTLVPEASSTSRLTRAVAALPLLTDAVSTLFAPRVNVAGDTLAL